MGRRRLAYPCRLYLDTFMLPYGGDEQVNGTFIEDWSTLLSSCAEGENRKTFFEIYKEFESMMPVVKSNFVTVVDSFLLSMWASFRQTLIGNLCM